MSTLTKLLFIFIILFGVEPAFAQVCTRDVIPQSVSPGNFNFVNDESQDKLSGLRWMRCVYGQTWDGVHCTGSPAKLTWQEALTIGSTNGWRLPHIKELQSIIDFQCINPPINPIIFPDHPASHRNGLWSSTPHLVETDVKTNAWYVDLNFGKTNYKQVDQTNFVRFIRK